MKPNLALILLFLPCAAPAQTAPAVEPAQVPTSYGVDQPPPPGPTEAAPARRAVVDGEWSIDRYKCAPRIYSDRCPQVMGRKIAGIEREDQRKAARVIASW